MFISDRKSENLNKREKNSLIDILIYPSKDKQLSPEEEPKNDNKKRQL